MSDLIEVFEGGESRRLGLLEQPESSLTCAWPVLGVDGTPDPIDRSQWYPVDLSAYVDRIMDQNGIGMCASAGTVGTIELARSMAGLPHIPLSGGDLYRRVSGGRDNGSLPEDNLKEILNNGVAPESDVPFLDWRGKHDSDKRKLFRGLEAWRLPTAAHVATALMKGFSCLIGYWHHNNDPVDKDGWMMNPSGPRGGHAVRVCGLVLRNGMWGFKLPNSWTSRWGVNGYGILPEKRVEEGCQVFQAWAMRCTTQEPGNFPAPKI